MRSYQLALLYAFLACSCSAHQEEAYVVAQPPSPAYVPEPAPSQPAPPETAASVEPGCKSLSEGCATEASSRLPITAAATVGPPAGWTYAITADQGVRLLSPGGEATMAFERLDSTKPDVVWPRLYVLLTELHVSGVVPEAITLAQPQGEWHADGLKIRVWQVEESQKIGRAARSTDPVMDGERGALLVGITEIDAENAVLGIGFLKRSAPKTFVSSMRQTMESLSARPQESAMPSPAPSPLPVPTHP